MISAFERFSLMFLAGAMAVGIGGAIVMRAPGPPSPVASSAPDERRSGNATTTSAPAATNDVAEASGYDLEAVAAGAAVPRVFDGLPPDEREAGHEMSAEENWRTILPLVLRVNEDILTDRKQLWSIRHNLHLGERLSPEQRIWLDLVAGRYAAPGGDLDELARRMDEIPPSIALAAVVTMQSGARAAGHKGKSTVTERAALNRRVRKETPQHLESPLETVRAYTRAANTASAYEGFRKERERLRLAGEPLDGLRLAAFLPKLHPGSQFGAAELSAMIGAYDLTRFDRARLQPQ